MRAHVGAHECSRTVQASPPAASVGKYNVNEKSIADDAAATREASFPPPPPRTPQHNDDSFQSISQQETKHQGSSRHDKRVGRAKFQLEPDETIHPTQHCRPAPQSAPPKSMHSTNPPSSRAWAGGVNMATADLATRVARVCASLSRAPACALSGASFAIHKTHLSTRRDLLTDMCMHHVNRPPSPLALTYPLGRHRRYSKNLALHSVTSEHLPKAVRVAGS